MTDQPTLSAAALEALDAALAVVVMAEHSDLAPYLTNRAEGFVAALAGVDPPLAVVPLDAARQGVGADLVLVRRDTGGVFLDGTTNHPGIDFDGPVESSGVGAGLPCQHAACTDVYDSDMPKGDPVTAIAWALAERSADGPHGSNERRRFRPLARSFLQDLLRDPRRAWAVRDFLDARLAARQPVEGSEK